MEEQLGIRSTYLLFSRNVETKKVDNWVGTCTTSGQGRNMYLRPGNVISAIAYVPANYLERTPDIYRRKDRHYTYNATISYTSLYTHLHFAMYLIRYIGIEQYS